MSPDSSKAQPGGGRLIVVVGPSGSGKDTLLDWLRANAGRDGRIVFARRTITRPAESGGEDHIAVDDAEFLKLEAEGAFAVTWQAHGLRYGLPARCLRQVREGHVVLVNGSRHALPAIAAAFDELHVIRLTVEPGELARRLLARGRETRDEIAARLTRPETALPDGVSVTEIDNSGPVEEAGRAVMRIIDSHVPDTRAERSASA